ncbi:PREDICTED: EF-hand calcium-binding domain-containing protein 3-like [Hipposideros armiger]|uniref:EF-hand calcium-binding domain-containing protein 3-like n=1 Tax=Hipposideros armiger TaxID=186990 RepID=A0A8B7T5Y0_HIPAR|nr:PREDICTED: EF-hand calcium-binding domain-containing protein 3-like [Hipposideros armiger]
MEPAAAMATGAEQTSQRAKEFKSLSATHSVQSGPGAGSQSFADKSLLPLTPQQLAAFQDIFKLFSSSPTGTVDMRSMKVALHNVGLQLSPQEMCEALQQADLDGDGTVSFQDFLGVLTDSHRLAQCLRQVTNSRVCDPQNLQTLFLEMLFKLMRQGFVPYKSAREVISYYSKKQRALRLNSGCKSPGRSHSHGRPACVQAGLTFFCQAARLSGLTNTELVHSLRRLHKAGVHSPYSQIPILAEGTRPEYKTRNRASRPEVRLPKSYPSKSYPSSYPKLGSNQGRRNQEFGDQPLEYTHPWKLAPSPPTLVQKQPFSPSPACLQRPAMKNLYK